MSAGVTLKLCGEDDRTALRRLAERDTAPRLTGPVIAAELEGELRAAISLETGAVIADPFHQTAWLVELVRARARQLNEGHRRRRPASAHAQGRTPAPGAAAGELIRARG